MIRVSADDFDFDTDEDARDYLQSIVEAMMRKFGIPRDEAIARINSEWSHVSKVVGEEDYMYREMPGYWANHFYYGKESFWWLDPPKRSEMGLPPLSPLPLQPPTDTEQAPESKN